MQKNYLQVRFSFACIVVHEDKFLVFPQIFLQVLEQVDSIQKARRKYTTLS